jgi:hypothetical protein
MFQRCPGLNFAFCAIAIAGLAKSESENGGGLGVYRRENCSCYVQVKSAGMRRVVFLEMMRFFWRFLTAPAAKREYNLAVAVVKKDQN